MMKLFSIARRYGTTVQAIMNANGLTDFTRGADVAYTRRSVKQHGHSLTAPP